MLQNVKSKITSPTHPEDKGEIPSQAPSTKTPVFYSLLKSLDTQSLLVGEVLNRGVRLAGLGRRRRLHGRRGRHGIAEQLLGQLRDALQVEGVEELEGEDDLAQLRMPGRPLEDAGPAGNGQVSVLVCQVRPLHRYVAVVAEVEAKYRFVSVTLLLRHMLDQDADPRRDPQPLSKVTTVNLRRIKRTILDPTQFTFMGGSESS